MSDSMDEADPLPNQGEVPRSDEPARGVPAAASDWYEPPRLGIIHLLA
jgi:hypothetical protein